MHQSRTLAIGWEVQKESSAVAYVAPAPHAAVVALGTIGTRQGDLAQLIRTMPSKSTHRLLVSEAGPCGDWRSRSLTPKGHGCWGVAPAVRPTKPGDRVTTTRREAIKLARLMRSGARTPVHGPRVEDAAMRNLCRAREATRRALQAAKGQRQALRLRHASRDTGRATWRPAHRRWRSAVGGPTPAQQSVFQAYGRAVTAHTDRRAPLDHARTDPGQTWRRAPVVDALQARRGGPGTVAGPPVAARGALTRFETPRQLLPSLSVTPSAYSTGERRPQGAIPQTGQSQARRALVEGAWASRDPATRRRHLP
jgi:transposase